jgi:hypothetical protein
MNRIDNVETIGESDVNTGFPCPQFTASICPLFIASDVLQRGVGRCAERSDSTQQGNPLTLSYISSSLGYV